MSNILYIDAFNGVAGDMVLGALVDLGLPLDHLREELSKLHLDGFEVLAEKIDRDGLFGTNLTVRLSEESETSDPERSGDRRPGAAGDQPGHSHARSVHDHHHDHGHDHSHDHEHDHDHPHHHHHHGAEGHGRHRGYREIREVIEGSGLAPRVKQRSVAIFERLARAEAKVHQSSLEDVHFHEVGALDAIVDIVGACIGFEFFGIDTFYSSPLALGGGTVTFSHGSWPVPAPATAELLRGFPTRLGPVEAEITTPTGAAIVSTLVDPARSAPPLTFHASGFGAGDRRFHEIPNMLRLMLAAEADQSGEVSAGAAALSREEAVLLEANIDDMDPQIHGSFLETALAAGALDVYFTPVQMKKNRPGIQLSLLCRPEDEERFADLIFRETTTLGIRTFPHQRYVLEREERTIETSMGPVRVKVGIRSGAVVNANPEFEDLSRIAARIGVPLKQVKQRVLAEMGEIK